MKKVVKTLEKIINKINGSLLCIGLNDDYLIKKIKSNHNIIYCDLLNSNIASSTKISKKKNKKLSNIFIKEFKKFYKKKNINYIISDIKDIKPYLLRFIQSSIYITSNMIYIYGSLLDDYEKLIKKYKRYTNKIDIDIYDKTFLLKIDVSNSKNNFFKDKIYLIIDNLERIADIIGDMLAE